MAHVDDFKMKPERPAWDGLDIWIYWYKDGEDGAAKQEAYIQEDKRLDI